MVPRSNWTRRLVVALLIIAALSSVLLGYRTYRSFQFLQSAYELGAPKTSAIRGWMTLKYLAAMYRIPDTALTEGLGLPPGRDPNTSLKSLADEARVSPPQYVRRVQRVIAQHTPLAGLDRDNAGSGWFGAIGDRVLTALLVYGYPVLGLMLLLGAIGLPLPDGLAMTVAGSLAAQERVSWIWAGGIALIASVVGDVIGYGIGRALGQEFLNKRGYWIGYTAARRARVHALFERWGGLTVFITRTFISYLSSVANLLAGVSRFRFSKFVAVAIAGRMLWTAAYLGLGYAIGSDLDAAASFLKNLSLLIVSAVIFAGSALVAFGRRPAQNSNVEHFVNVPLKPNMPSGPHSHKGEDINP